MCSAQTIQGIRKKGKEFMRFNTHVNEDIVEMHVAGSTIYTCGAYMLHAFTDEKEDFVYRAPDRICDMAVAPGQAGVAPFVVLACQDKVVRVLRLGQVVYQTRVSGAVTALRLTSVALVGTISTTNSCVYGCDDGRVGILYLGKDAITSGWLLEPGTGDTIGADSASGRPSRFASFCDCCTRCRRCFR